jgi:hypothetical protein
MPTQCFPFAQGRRLRVTALDNCGNPSSDECAQVVSSGFVQVSVSSNTITGTSIQPLNAAGQLCYRLQAPDVFTGHNLSIEFCEVDPSLMGLVTLSNPVLDYAEDIVGFQTVAGSHPSGYALEVWMGVPGVDCPPEGENPVDSLGYVLFPFIIPGALGDFTIGNDAINFTVSGYTKGNGNWGVGPYDVVAEDAANVAGPLLEAVPSDVHAHLQWTSIPAPDAECGCQPVIPS